MGQEIEDGRLLFLVLFLHALGLLVGDALVAVDAGLAVALRQLVLLPRALFLHLAVHALEAVAVAALARARALHALPLVLGQLQALGLELLRRVDGAHELAVEFVGGLDLPRHLVHPVLGHVAVGTDGAHPGAVLVVDGLLVFLIDRVAHLVAGDAELQLVGRFHGGVEAAPEDNAGEESDHQQGQQGIFGAGPAQGGPQAFREA